MSKDKKTETPELIDPPMVSDSVKPPEMDMVKDGIQSSMSIPPASAEGNGAIKVAITQPLVLLQGVYYPPTTFHDYYYSGYNHAFAQPAGIGNFNTSGGPYTGVANSPLIYHLPCYGPYTTGFVGNDGKQAYASPGFLQQPCSYGSGPFPCYSFDPTAPTVYHFVRSTKGLNALAQANEFNTTKTCSNLHGKTSSLPNIQHPAHFLQPFYHNHSLNSLNKLGSNFQYSGLIKGKDQNPAVMMRYGPVNYQTSSVWNSTQRYNSPRSGEIKAQIELTSGSRADNTHNNSSNLPSEHGFVIKRDAYNSKEFQTQYDSAKFFVIKSYSEDDIHKSIKYSVWSSTTNGNKKLDVAFHEADAKTSETGAKCPVFLFFSENGSGQFVGVAEMIGPIDLSKNMDFWQLDKWNGFFPAKWHIIKDVPNALLCHITLEANENRPVTHSRDTQEIGLKQGLELLCIFKNYSEKTSILDDLEFYEQHEKALKAKRNTKATDPNNGNC